MKILAIDTSCDETSASVVESRRVLSNSIFSQILIHQKWGGVVPNLAKKAHEEHIDLVISDALKKSRTKIEDVDYIAVTQGPGLAVALEVGIRKAKELSKKYHKKLIAVNHMEGHIYSCFVQNKNGNPPNPFSFPYLALLVSGAHSELVLFSDHMKYEIIGQTIDDAAGEALDKAARMLGLGYPGGPVLESLSLKGNKNYFRFPRPLEKEARLDFSFSGLKTSLFYFLKNLDEQEKNKHIADIAASFQEAVFESLEKKLIGAIKKTGVVHLLVGGGVSANADLKRRIRNVAKKNNGSVLFPASKLVYGDNAAMIGVAAGYKAEKGMVVEDPDSLERTPRMILGQ